jgi:phosphoglycolate phosphatase
VKFRAILFDVDGTLLNTLEDLANSMNEVLRGQGFPVHDKDAYRYFVGDGVRNLALRALPEDKRDDATVDRTVSGMHQEYGKRWAETTRPYYGVPKMMNWLEEHGVKKAILSNKDDGFTARMISRFLPHWKFADIRGARDNVPLKPDPAAALEIAHCMEMEPGQFLYVGDSATDMRTAVAAGMYPVGASWGFRTIEELKEAGAQAILKKPVDIGKQIL